MHLDKYIIVRTLNLNDIQEITRCLRVTTSVLSSDLFISPSLEYIITIISGYGYTAGAFYKDSLIGFASFVFPKRGKNNLGHYLHYDEKKLFSVVQLEHICIEPKFRRNGIAEQLIHYLILQTKPQFSIILSTVSPRNTPSLALAFKIKQRIVSYVEIYGVSRFIMCKKLLMQNNKPETILCEIPRKEISRIDTMLKYGYEAIAFGSQNTTFILSARQEKE